MKKWLAGLLILLLLISVSPLLLIPSHLQVNSLTITHAPVNSVSRVLADPAAWNKWWRNKNGRPPEGTPSFRYGSSLFGPNGKSSNIIGILISDDSLKINSFITLVTFGPDSTGIDWAFDMPTSTNILTRVRQYQKAGEIRENMKAVMENLRAFLSDPNQVYGGTIYRRSTSDTLLVAAKYNSPAYPRTPAIYQMLEPVRKYILSQHATMTGQPMVNITRLPDSSFQIQVAIPTSKKLPGNGDIFYRRMVPGNFMVMDVKGGDEAVRIAQQNLEYFVTDVGKTKMAIPFQLLVTDRLQETDSTKWLTEIYLPVVQ